MKYSLGFGACILIAVIITSTSFGQVYFSLSRVTDFPSGHRSDISIDHGVIAYLPETSNNSLVINVAGEEWRIVDTNTVLPGNTFTLSQLFSYDLRGLDVVFHAQSVDSGVGGYYKVVNGVLSRVAALDRPAIPEYCRPRFSGNELYFAFNSLLSTRTDIYRVRQNTLQSIYATSGAGFNLGAGARDVRARKGVVIFFTADEMRQVSGDTTVLLASNIDALEPYPSTLVDGGYVYSANSPHLRINLGGSHSSVSGSPGSYFLNASGRNFFHTRTSVGPALLDDAKFSPLFNIYFDSLAIYPYYDITPLFEFLFSFTRGNRVLAKGELILNRDGQNHQVVEIPSGMNIRDQVIDASDRAFLFCRQENNRKVLYRASELGWEPTPIAKDFDGDGLADPGLYEIAAGYWLQRLTDGAPSLQQYGYSGVMPAPGDYDADQRADLSVFDPRSAVWYAYMSSGNMERTVIFTPGGTLVPVVGDFDGDGYDDRAVFERNSSRWEIKTATGQSSSLIYGFDVVQPVPADYDNDGKDDVAVYHAPTGKWYIKGSSGLNSEFSFGFGGTVAVPGNFRAGGGDEVAIYEPSTSMWYIRNTTGPYTAIMLGPPGGIPRAADFDGDGLDDFAIYDPFLRKWHVQMSTDGLQVF